MKTKGDARGDRTNLCKLGDPDSDLPACPRLGTPLVRLCVLAIGGHCTTATPPTLPRRRQTRANGRMMQHARCKAAERNTRGEQPRDAAPCLQPHAPLEKKRGAARSTSDAVMGVCLVMRRAEASVRLRLMVEDVSGVSVQFCAHSEQRGLCSEHTGDTGKVGSHCTSTSTATRSLSLPLERPWFLSQEGAEREDNAISATSHACQAERPVVKPVCKGL